MTRPFAGKIAIVTGATSGIGRAAALALADGGADLIVTGRDRARGAETVAMIEQRGRQAAFVVQDAREESDWPPVIAAALTAFGRIDILVNNAGGIIVKPLEKLTLEDHQLMLRANLESAFLGIRAVWPHLKAAGGGTIVNITALMGERTAAIGVAYAPAKAAEIGLTKAAAAEGAPFGIRVNSVMPGLIWSEGWIRMAGPDPEATKAGLGKSVPLGRVGTPAEVAHAVAFLCSNGAAHINGIDYPVDGGRLAG